MVLLLVRCVCGGRFGGVIGGDKRVLAALDVGKAYLRMLLAVAGRNGLRGEELWYVSNALRILIMVKYIFQNIPHCQLAYNPRRRLA